MLCCVLRRERASSIRFGYAQMQTCACACVCVWMCVCTCACVRGNLVACVHMHASATTEKISVALVPGWPAQIVKCQQFKLQRSWQCHPIMLHSKQRFLHPTLTGSRTVAALTRLGFGEMPWQRRRQHRRSAPYRFTQIAQ